MAPRRNLAIVIPAFNAASTIAETLASIERQSRLERIAGVYVADDASTDNTVEVVQSAWRGNFPNTLVRNDSNLGERATLNKVVHSFPGHIEWFFILHAEDIAKANWVEIISRRIEQHRRTDILAVTASYDILDKDDTLTPGDNRGEFETELIAGDAATVQSTLQRGCWFKVSSCAIRTSAFRELDGFRADLPQLGDWEFVLRGLRADGPSNTFRCHSPYTVNQPQASRQGASGSTVTCLRH